MSVSPNQSTDRSLSAIVGDATRDISTLVRKEIELAKLELTREAGKMAAAGGLFGAAGALAVVAFLFLSAALGFGLWELGLEPWAAALAVGVLYLLIAGIMAAVGSRTLKNVNATPERTIRTIKEDVAWARNRKN